MARLTILAAGAAMLALGLAGAGAAAQDAAPVERGRELVLRNCGMCHAVGLADESPNPAAPRFREIGRNYPIENLSEALAEGIVTGHPDMPEFAFDPDDVAAIVHYLETIQTRKGAAGPSSAPG